MQNADTDGCHEGALRARARRSRRQFVWIDAERAQRRLKLIAIESGDCNTLELRTFATDDCHVPLCRSERLCDDLNQFVIRCTFHGRRLQPNQQRAVADASDARLTGTWNDPDGDLGHRGIKAFVRFVMAEGLRGFSRLVWRWLDSGRARIWADAGRPDRRARGHPARG